MVIAGDFGGDLLNSGTISSIGTNSIVELYNSASVTGGTWNNSAGGVLRVRPGQTGNLFAPNIAAGSTFTVPGTAASTSQLNLNGDVTLNGILNLDAQGNQPLLSLPTAVTLSGTGAIKGTYGGSGNGPRIDAINGTLTVGAGNTVQGVIHFNNSRVINNGTILADALPNMFIDPHNGAPNLFVNNGTMRNQRRDDDPDW